MTLFGPRAPYVLAVIGLLAFLAWAGLNAYGDDLRDGRDGGGHALSESATGFSGLVALLQAAGNDVTTLRRAEAAGKADLVVLTPGERTKPEDLSKLWRAVPDEHFVLIVLPKWATVRQPQKAGWVWRIDTLPTGPTQTQINEALGRSDIRLAQAVGSVGRISGPDYSVVAPGNLRTIAGKGIEPVVQDADGRIVLGEVMDGLYVLADPDLIANHGIARIEDARAAVALMGWLAEREDSGKGRAGSIAFDVTLNGFGAGSRNLGKLALAPPFLGLTLSLLAAAIMAALAALPRFGAAAPDAPANARGKQALIDNAAELIRAAGQEGAAALRYAGQALERAAAFARLPPGLSPAEQAQRLGGDHAELAAAAAAAKGPQAALAAAQALHDWEESLHHARN
jgi:hypothetical protein